MGENDRRRNERGTSAHDTHSQRRGSHSQQGDEGVLASGSAIVMQPMLDEAEPKLKTGVRMLSETVRADALRRRHWATTRRPTRMCCCAPAMHRSDYVAGPHCGQCKFRNTAECGSDV